MRFFTLSLSKEWEKGLNLLFFLAFFVTFFVGFFLIFLVPIVKITAGRTGKSGQKNYNRKQIMHTRYTLIDFHSSFTDTCEPFQTHFLICVKASELPQKTWPEGPGWAVFLFKSFFFTPIKFQYSPSHNKECAFVSFQNFSWKLRNIVLINNNIY